MTGQILMGVSAICLLLQGAASAQQSTDRIDTIVVMATKREQTLQDVPVAVSVVENETIERAQVIDLLDLQTLVPSLRISQQQTAGTTNFFVRGFGNGADNPGIEPSVGVFIDGVYRSWSAAAISDLVDIERVEVLRGPQSTLFGKNASAGVISVVTQEPQFDFEAKAEATFGNFDQRLVRGFVTGPVADRLAFSIAGSVNKRDGFAENEATGRDINDRDRFSVRGQLLFNATQNLSFRLIADHDEIDEVCCVAGALLAGPTAGAITALGGRTQTEGFFDREVFYSFEPQSKITNSGLSLQADWDLSFGELSSITAFRERDEDQNLDVDFSTLSVFADQSSTTDVETFSQELRLSGDWDRGSWLIGAFYLDEQVSFDDAISYGEDFRPYIDLLTTGVVSGVEGALTAFGFVPAGVRFFGAGQEFVSFATQENEALSVFGQLDFELTDRLTLTAGLAYNYDEKQITLSALNTDVFFALDLVTIGGQVVAEQLGAGGASPSEAETIAAEAASRTCSPALPDATPCNPFLALQALQFSPPFLDVPNAVETGRSEDDATTYTLRAAFEVSEKINVYASWSTGFKATSWNLTRDSRPFAADLSVIGTAGLATPNLAPGTRFAGPEDSEVFEIGVKAT